MAEQPRQQQLQTSFLFIQLRAPPAGALPTQSPATAASEAAPGGLEEGPSFPSPRTGFLAGWGPGSTQGFAAPSSSLLQEEGPRAEQPAALRSSPKEKGKGKSRHRNVTGGGDPGPPHPGRCLAPASRKLRLSYGLPNPAPVMSHGSRAPSTGCRCWPVPSGPQDLWSTDPLSRNDMRCPGPQAALAPAADRSPRDEGDPGTTVRATRAQLYRYCPAIQISRNYPAPPAALPLQAETFVWVNNASAHSQSVAKAKYEFLFGRSEDKTPHTSDHGGSTLLPPNVTNEFPEYGTMEEGGEGLRTSLEFDVESLPCCPPGEQGLHLLAGQDSGLHFVTEGPNNTIEAPSQGHLKEQSLQPIDSLISALKATEARIASETLHKATKVLDKDAVSVFSVQQVEKEPDTASHKTQRAITPFPAGQEKPSGIPLAEEEMTEENFYLSIQKDLTALLTAETQPDRSQIPNSKKKGARCAREPACPAASLRSSAGTSHLAGHVGLLEEQRSDLGREHAGGCDRGGSWGRPGRAKHVEFQGVEVLWTGGEKKKVQYSAVDSATLLGRTALPASGEFPRVAGLRVSGTDSCSSVSLTESASTDTRSASAERPGTSLGPLPPVPLAESGEDEVFLKANHQPEKNSEGDNARLLEEEDHLRGGEDDILGTGYTEDSTDVYSSQFETILDNTSLYYSAESLETLYSEPDSYFSFEMPLTPMIQQRIKEGGQFLERTSARGHQDILSVSSDGGIVMGYSSGITNGLNDAGDSFYSRGSPEIAYWGSNAGVKKAQLEDHSEMGSTHILEKETTESLSNGTSSNAEAAKRLAKRLYQLDRFKRSDVAKHLGKNNEFSRLVAEEYLKFFDFTGMTLDQSLRYFFKAFSLVGETQERERVLIHFSNRYFYCNPDTIASQDGVHCLTCAMMLLNTDLHGHNIGKKMTCQEFIANLQGVNEGVDFSKDLLKALYNSIKNEKLEWAVVVKEVSSKGGRIALQQDLQPRSAQVVIGVTAVEAIIQCWGVRELLGEGERSILGVVSPRGKRGWKTFYAVLKGTVLYLQKDEYKPEKALSEEDLKNAVSVHHALASKATDYEKKPNVFKLKTADWRVLLFQTQSPEEMQGWINRINCVAAVFSAPPFPAAIGSQKKFSRPLLPATTTKLSQEEQLKSHESKLKQITTELAEHRSYPPDKKVKAKDVDEYKLKDHYLEFEKTRYETYVGILKEGGKQLLSRDENEAAGLKKSHSSPSLNPDSSPVTAKVKRNVSERKDHRPETPGIKQKVT
ncbi:PH and SEC7 domain-containing protein 3 [Octodon degus]|uniref:PH and SEC7 domain-containing protein 3 n=1 Tax=Octodon degus TaxID=10160 RepID=A0A6P6EDL5_OCTDE|nr:PH and SEC7 domain-containing protein 3 [Octodon degus]